MEGIIISFRRAKHAYKPRQFIVDAGVDKKKAASLLNKEVIWKSPQGKIIKGIVKKLHGNKGCLRVLFERGLPGQAILGKVEIK